MPKETRSSSGHDHHRHSEPYPQIRGDALTANIRSTAIWSTADDAVLLRARASGLNWQPIATRHFPNKTANACRKRHERLVERRQAEDWDTQKLELLAQEYMICRRQMWETLAARLGERWNVVEAKCMEKGLKTIQSTARTAHRRASASFNGSFAGSAGNSDHHSDSGIGLGSDAEMEVGEDVRPSLARSDPVVGLWPPTYTRAQHPQPCQPQDHNRSRSLSYALPLYKPPPPPAPSRHHRQEHTRFTEAELRPRTYTPVSHASATASHNPHRVMGIQSMLAPAGA